MQDAKQMSLSDAQIKHMVDRFLCGSCQRILILMVASALPP